MTTTIYQDLSVLTLRAIVAIATRAARRLHPLYACWAKEHAEEKHVLSLIALTEKSERVIRSEDLFDSFGDELEANIDIAHDLAFISHDERGVGPSFATLGASGCALLYCNYILAPSPALLEHMRESAEAVVIHGGTDCYASFRNDYARTLAANFGQFPSPGPPFDPGDSGPLGPLWTGAIPDWRDRGLSIISSLSG